MLAFHCRILNLVWLGSSNQRKCKQHRIADFRSLLASSSSLSSKGFLCHCIPRNFLHRLLRRWFDEWFVQGRNFPGSASEFEWRNVYVPWLRHKRRIHASLNRWLSKLTSTFVLAPVEGIFMPLRLLWFSTLAFTKSLQIDATRLKIMLMFTESLWRVFVWPSENRESGVSDRKKSERKKWVWRDPELTAG